MVLANRLDTNDMRENIPRFISMVNLLQVNTKENAGKLNLRYLMGLEVVVNSMLTELDQYSTDVNSSIERLNEVESTLKSARPDTSLISASDSLLKYGSVRNEMSNLDISIKDIEGK